MDIVIVLRFTMDTYDDLQRAIEASMFAHQTAFEQSSGSDFVNEDAELQKAIEASFFGETSDDPFEEQMILAMELSRSEYDLGKTSISDTYVPNIKPYSPDLYGIDASSDPPPQPDETHFSIMEQQDKEYEASLAIDREKKFNGESLDLTFDYYKNMKAPSPSRDNCKIRIRWFDGTIYTINIRESCNLFKLKEEILRLVVEHLDEPTDNFARISTWDLQRSFPKELITDESGLIEDYGLKGETLLAVRR